MTHLSVGGSDGCPSTKGAPDFASGISVSLLFHFAVTELCPNPTFLAQLRMPFERKQLPQIVESKHNRVDGMEPIGPLILLRNQQVAGSSPAGGSI